MEVSPYASALHGHGVGVLVGGLGRAQDRQIPGQDREQLLANRAGVGGLRILGVVLEEVAPVLGDDTDVAGLDLGQVDLALSDLVLARDRIARRLQHLGVDLGDDLVGIVLLAAHDNGPGSRVLGVLRGERISAESAGAERAGHSGQAGDRENAAASGGRHQESFL